MSGLTPTQSDIGVPANVKMNFSINVLVHLTIEQYFADFRCLLIYTDNESNFHYTNQLPIVNFNLDDPNVNINLTFRSFGCQGIIINTRNPETFFENFEHTMRFYSDRFNKRRYLFIASYKAVEDVANVFHTYAINYVADVLTISPTKSSKPSKKSSIVDTVIQERNEIAFNLHTHRYTGYDGHNEIVLLDVWFAKNFSFLYGNNLYPEKLHNQKRRVLKVATFTYKPYSVPSNNSWESDGTEIYLALLYAKRHNMTPVMLIDEAGQWGIIHENWTGDGIIGNLVKDLADIGLGALYTWEHVYGFLDLSKPVIRTGITCLVPAPKLAGGWLTPILSFNLTMWVAVGISFILGIISMFLLKFVIDKIRESDGRDGLTGRAVIQEATLIVLGAFVQQSIPPQKIPEAKLAKCLFGLILLLTILVATCYSSGLASSMTIPRFIGAIRTVQDLADSNVQWGATSDAWIMSIVGEKQPKYVTILKNFIIANETELVKRGKGRFGFSIERLPGGYYAIGSYVEYNNLVKNLRILHEDLYWEQSVIMMRKNSIFLPSMEKLILQIQEAGFMPNWEFNVVSKHLDGNIQKAVKFSRFHEEQRTEAVKLRWKDVEGAFGVWILGNIIAFLIYILEIYINYLHVVNEQRRTFFALKNYYLE